MNSERTPPSSVSGSWNYNRHLKQSSTDHPTGALKQQQQSPLGSLWSDASQNLSAQTNLCPTRPPFSSLNNTNACPERALLTQHPTFFIYFKDLPGEKKRGWEKVENEPQYNAQA